MASFRYLVNDVEKSISFYTQFLGFKLEQQFGPAMAIVSKNDFTLWLAGPIPSQTSFQSMLAKTCKWSLNRDWGTPVFSIILDGYRQKPCQIRTRYDLSLNSKISMESQSHMTGGFHGLLRSCS